MTHIKTVIVDDEPAAVEVITALMREFTSDLKLEGHARNGLEAIKMITEIKPDLVFLDVDMPILNGFQVLEKLPPMDFEVIFTTGSSQYALKALKLKAIDYLLKPIDPADFIVAVDRMRHQLLSRHQNNFPARLQLPTQHGFIFLDESDIIHVAGMGSYCQVHTTKNDKIVISKNIGQIEEKLSPDRFFRCHNSHIINLDFISKFLNKEGYTVEMKDGTQIDVSRRSKEKLLETLAERTK